MDPVAQLWLPTLVLVTGVAVVLFGASLYLRFALSEGELLGVAREPPARHAARDAGLYTVRDHVRSVNGAVLLVTHFCGLSECGFAYSPDREPREVCRTYDHQRFEHLAGDWYAFVLDTAYEGDPC